MINFYTERASPPLGGEAHSHPNNRHPELPEDENIWLGKLDNRLDRNGARKIIDAIDRLGKAARMGAYVDAIYNANFEIMEEVSKMSNMTATLDKTLENAGYVTRKMILAGIQAKEEKAREIAQNLISRGFDMKETAEITGMDIEKVRALSEQ